MINIKHFTPMMLHFTFNKKKSVFGFFMHYFNFLVFAFFCFLHLKTITFATAVNVLLYKIHYGFNSWTLYQIQKNYKLSKRVSFFNTLIWYSNLINTALDSGLRLLGVTMRVCVWTSVFLVSVLVRTLNADADEHRMCVHDCPSKRTIPGWKWRTRLAPTMHGHSLQATGRERKTHRATVHTTSERYTTQADEKQWSAAGEALERQNIRTSFMIHLRHVHTAWCECMWCFVSNGWMFFFFFGTRASENEDDILYEWLKCLWLV